MSCKCWISTSDMNCGIRVLQSGLSLLVQIGFANTQVEVCVILPLGIIN